MLEPRLALAQTEGLRTMSNFITRMFGGGQEPPPHVEPIVQERSVYAPPQEELACASCGASDDLMVCNGVLTCRSCTVQHIHRLQVREEQKRLPGGRHHAG